MKIADWKELHHRLQTDPFYGTDFADKPTDRAIEEFETENGFRLPRSYREFISEFGPGELFARLEIAAPGCAELGTTWDLTQRHESLRPMDDELADAPPDSRPLLNRLFFFALDAGDNWIAWDLSEPQQGESVEYPIYSVGRRLKATLVAASFRDYIQRLSDESENPDPSWDEEELGSKQRFRPAAKE